MAAADSDFELPEVELPPATSPAASSAAGQPPVSSSGAIGRAKRGAKRRAPTAAGRSGNRTRRVSLAASRRERDESGMDEDDTAPAERPPAGKTGRRTRRVSPAAWGRERGGAEMDEQEAAPAENPPDVSSHASVTAMTPPTRAGLRSMSNMNDSFKNTTIFTSAPVFPTEFTSICARKPMP